MIKVKVLLVEDRLSFLDLWQIEFEEHGHEVDQAHNEDEAIQKLTGQSFDAVVIDVHLVDGDGSEEGGLKVGRWMRAHQEERIQHLPIVFAVVNPDEQHRKEFGCLTEDGKRGRVLLKPFASRELRQTVEELISEESAEND